jgi:hypothetical protein
MSALMTAETIYGLMGTDPQWRTAAGQLVAQHQAFVQSPAFDCGLFSAAFLTFLREVIGAEGGTVCQEVGHITPSQRDTMLELAIANEGWLWRPSDGDEIAAVIGAGLPNGVAACASLSDRPLSRWSRCPGSPDEIQRGVIQDDESFCCS